jgi:hypothetical protein
MVGGGEGKEPVLIAQRVGKACINGLNVVEITDISAPTGNRNLTVKFKSFMIQTFEAI